MISDAHDSMFELMSSEMFPKYGYVKLHIADPPVDGRLLVLIDSVVVGGGIVVHTVLCSTMT